MTHISFATPPAYMQSGVVYEPSTTDLQLLLETDDLFEDIHIAAPLGLGHVCALPHTVLRQRTLKVLRVYADCTLPDGLETLPLESLAYMSASYQLPQSLMHSRELCEMRLSGRCVPLWLRDVATLRSLRVHGPMTPQQVGNVTQCVQVTDLELNRPLELDAAIFAMGWLTALDITMFDGSAVPDLTALTSLRVLCVTNSLSLTSLPGLEQLSRLETLCLASCGKLNVQNLASLGALRSLEICAVHGFDYKPLPPNLTKLNVLGIANALEYASSGLRECTLSHRQCAWDASNVAAHSCLEKLELYNFLHDLPDDIAFLTGLTELRLFNTGCTTLPEAVGRLQVLRSLYLHTTRITVIPEFVGTMPALCVLSIIGNILQLPSQLHKVQTFALGSCRDMATLPDIFSTSLGELHLSRTHMTLPPWLEECARHRWTRLSVPVSVAVLPYRFLQQNMLTKLDIRDNAVLTGLPDGPVCLPRLAELDLAGCMALTALPAWVADLPALHTLDLTACTTLTALPDRIGYLPCLKRLRMFGSHLETLPASLIRLRRQLVLEVGSMPNLQFIPVCLAEMCWVPVAMKTRLAASYRLRHVLVLVLAGRRGKCRLPSEVWVLIVDMLPSVWSTFER
jgi:Leucine-rich repeat (LRR) protein